MNFIEKLSIRYATIFIYIFIGVHIFININSGYFGSTEIYVKDTKDITHKITSYSYSLFVHTLTYDVFNHVSSEENFVKIKYSSFRPIEFWVKDRTGNNKDMLKDIIGNLLDTSYGMILIPFPNVLP